MLPRRSFLSFVALFGAGAALVTTGAPVLAAPFGPRLGAELSVEKLAPIEDFINGEVAAGRIPGAIVLIQRHGKPIYFKCFGKRDPDAGNANDGGCDLSDSFGDQDDHQRRGDDADRSGQDRARRSRQQIHSVVRRHEGRRRAKGRFRPSGARSGAVAPAHQCRGSAAAHLRHHLRFLWRGLVKAAYDGIYLGDFDNAGFAERIAKVPLAEQPRTVWITAIRPTSSAG